MNILTRIEIFKEDDMYVALTPELNISSFAETVDEARSSLREAIEAFIEECVRMGTLHEVLEEAGFSKLNDCWQARKPLMEEELSVAV